MKRYLTLCILAITAFTVGCNEPGDVWSPQEGKLYVWDNTITELDVGTGNPVDFNTMRPILFCPQKYSKDPYDQSSWDETNKALLDKMVKQFKDSPYRDSKERYVLEFTSIEGISIKSNQKLMGREQGEELADMFLIKPLWPYFTFPDGNLVEKELYDKWMSIDEWIAADCIGAGYVFKPKEQTTCGDYLVLSFKVESLDSWHYKPLTRRATAYLQKTNGKYLMASDFLDNDGNSITYEEMMDMYPYLFD